MLGVFLDSASLDLGDIDFSDLNSSLAEIRDYSTTTSEQIVERIADAELVISNKVALNAALAAAPRLRLVCVAAAGTNNVDLKTATGLGITVCNCQGYSTPSVVQHTFALMLALTLKLCGYHQAVAENRWQTAKQFCLLDFPIRELALMRRDAVADQYRPGRHRGRDRAGRGPVPQRAGRRRCGCNDRRASRPWQPLAGRRCSQSHRYPSLRLGQSRIPPAPGRTIGGKYSGLLGRPAVKGGSLNADPTCSDQSTV